MLLAAMPYDIIPSFCRYADNTFGLPRLKWLAYQTAYLIVARLNGKYAKLTTVAAPVLRRPALRDLHGLA